MNKDGAFHFHNQFAKVNENGEIDAWEVPNRKDPTEISAHNFQMYEVDNNVFPDDSFLLREPGNRNDIFDKSDDTVPRKR